MRTTAHPRTTHFRFPFHDDLDKIEGQKVRRRTPHLLMAGLKRGERSAHPLGALVPSEPPATANLRARPGSSCLTLPGRGSGAFSGHLATRASVT